MNRIIIAVATVVVLATAPVAVARPFGKGGGPTSAGGAPTMVTTHDVLNGSGSTDTNAPYVWGQVFQEGDVPSGNYPVITDNSGNPIAYQFDEASTPYPDGSMHYAVFSTFVPSVASGAVTRLRISRTPGTYSPSSQPRSISDLTAHQFQVRYLGVTNSSGAGVNGPSGHNNWLCDDNTFIAAGQYEIHGSKGPVRMEVKVYGFATDAGASGSTTGGASSPWLWCESWYDVFSNPANLSAVGNIRHIHRLNQPFVDVASPDAMIGQAQVYDGATLIRDFGADNFTFTQAAVTIGTGPQLNIASPPSPIVGGEVYQFHVVSGSAPGGLTEGQLVFMGVNCCTGSPQVNPIDTAIYLGTSPRTNVTGADAINITSVGSGSFQFNRRQFTSYYGGFWTANDQGTEFWTGSDPGLFVDLDGLDNGTTQKTYWQASGAIPSWDLSGGSAIGANTAIPLGVNVASQIYRPGTAATARINIGGTGGGLNVGPFTEFEARGFARMGATNWAPSEQGMMIANALTMSHFPYAIMKFGTTGHILPVNNGTPTGDGSGPTSTGSYTTLGTAHPTYDVISPTSTDNINIPANATAWASGPFTATTANDHWPRQSIIPWLLTGRRHLLEITRENANHLIVCNPISTGFNTYNEINREKHLGNPTATSKIFYASVLITQQPRGSMGIMDVALMSALAPAADPETPYFTDVLNANFGMQSYFLTTFKTSPSSTTTVGWVNPNNVFIDQSFMNSYVTIALSYAKNVTRNAGASAALNFWSTYTAGAWDGTTTPISPYWATTENWAEPEDYNPSGPSGIVAPWNQQGVLAGTATISTGGVWTDSSIASGLYPLENNDRVYAVGVLTLGTYDGPPEYGSRTLYYLCNLNTGAGTFQLCTGSGGSGPITSLASSHTGQFYVVVPQYAPPTGLFNGDDTIPDEYGLLSRGALNMATQSGASPATGTLAAAASNATARWTGNYNAIAANNAYKYSMLPTPALK